MSLELPPPPHEARTALTERIHRRRGKVVGVIAFSEKVVNT